MLDIEESILAYQEKNENFSSKNEEQRIFFQSLKGMKFQVLNRDIEVLLHRVKNHRAGFMS